MELGEVLRDRRKAAGRTIASVAMDAGLSVPYIANLENGRGNPTVAALDRLAEALGTRLEVRIGETVDELPSVGAELVDASPRGADVIKAVVGRGRTRAAVHDDLVRTIDALGNLLGQPPTTADLDRLLDLVLLAEMRSRAVGPTD
ncbi:helix-turn-helix transcriptional regulator [Kribbella sp. NPDC005582]|uniref:helix-turn-helix domain-containing protein n=1 Tax=Kribbella sp. NPDC005582 TaxID=3156893 RepID=UPI0033A737B3